MNKTEYNSTSTNSISCYSNLDNYGVSNINNKRKIISPVPVVQIPSLFINSTLKPHNMQTNGLKKQSSKHCYYKNY